MEIEQALGDADVPILLMVLVHLTGDRRWLQAPYLPQRDSRIFAAEDGGLLEDVQDEVRRAALAALSDPGAQPHELEPELLAEMMSVCVGEPVGPEYVPLFLEEMGFRAPPSPAPAELDPEEFSVVVIGAGLSGICATIMLEDAGIPHVVLEKNDGVGGSWYANTYPEAGVDTPNHFYSFSFAADHRWTRYYSKQPEIQGYAASLVERFGVGERIRLSTHVREAVYDEDAQRWDVHATGPDGAPLHLRADALITAVGLLDEPKLPPIDGIETFAGELFHTQRWRDDVVLEGKRVAIVGTGASAMQIARSTAEKASQLTIFQRSPQWVTPNPDYHRTISEAKQTLLADVPFYAAWYRFALFWRYADSLHPFIQVQDDWEHPERAVSERNDKHRRFLTRFIEAELEGREDLLAKTVPDYPPYGKRMLLDNDWFATLRREDVELVAEAVTGATPSGLIDATGTQREFDVVILATGFHTTRVLWPTEVRGRGGVSIHDAWDTDDARAYLGMTVPGFPNMFMLLGPNTGLGHGGSAIFHSEAQARYVVRCLQTLIERGGALEPTVAATDAYNARVDAAHERMVFAHPGMDNWYKNSRGRVTALSPWRLVDYWAMIREVELDDYVLEPARISRS